MGDFPKIGFRPWFLTGRSWDTFWMLFSRIPRLPIVFALEVARWQVARWPGGQVARWPGDRWKVGRKIIMLRKKWKMCPFEWVGGQIAICPFDPDFFHRWCSLKSFILLAFELPLFKRWERTKLVNNVSFTWHILVRFPNALASGMTFMAVGEPDYKLHWPRTCWWSR